MPSLDEGARRKVGAPVADRGETVSEGKVRQGAHVVEMQRRRLLSALVEVLGEHGYEGATVGRVCKRAGVSRRTFYDLYDDREGCFLDAFELAIERLAKEVAPFYSGEGDARRAQAWRVRVRGGLTALLECFDSEPGLARLCLVETLKGGPAVLERRRAVAEALAVAIDAGRAEAKAADPPRLTAESLVGGAASVIHARLVKRPGVGAGQARSAGGGKPEMRAAPRMLELLNPLMSMIILPYLGPAASRKELDLPVPRPRPTAEEANGHVAVPASDPFRNLPIRITFRTVRVLSTVGGHPDASNREIGEDAGVIDQGQMSKLLRRLEKAGLIENHGEGQTRGEANAWRLTPYGHGVLHAVGGDGDALG
jgi:AcrR family transcriptional regulator